MRFFKYLFFLNILLFSSYSFSYEYSIQSFNQWRATPELACAVDNATFRPGTFPGWPEYVGRCHNGRNVIRGGQPKCPAVGSSMFVHIEANGSIPSVKCVSVDGQKCKFVNNHPNQMLITSPGGNTPNVQLQSASTTPDPYCEDQFDGSCNKNDPYGGCYIPPNDDCIRYSDGSIFCPDKTPPIKNTCGGATYCKRPPEGCGTGYVSGSFNGQALCVKKGPNSPPRPDDEGGETDPTGNNSNTSTSTSTSTSSSSSGDGTGGGINVTNINNNTNNTTVNVDVAGIINAVKNMKDTLNVSLSTLNDKVKTVSDTLTGTNQKLDTANTTLNSINQKNQVTNDKLQELINKPGGTSQGNFDGSGIVDSVNSFKDKFIEFFGTERDTSDLEQIGQESNDPRSNGARDNATSAFQNLANVLTFSNSSCVPDLEINNIPLFHSVVIPLSNWCDLLAMVKILLHLGVLLTALRMVTDTVRVI